MAVGIISALLFAFAASAASDEILDQLLQAVQVLNNNVAYYSSVVDPRLKCLTCSLIAFNPEELFAEYRFSFQGQNGEPGTDVYYCANLNVTDTFVYGLSLCEEGANQTTSQGLYFNGESCFIGTYPILGNEYCLLWVKEGFQDSVPEECLTAFNSSCGPEKYSLYNEEECS